MIAALFKEIFKRKRQQSTPLKQPTPLIDESTTIKQPIPLIDESTTIKQAAILLSKQENFDPTDVTGVIEIISSLITDRSTIEMHLGFPDNIPSIDMSMLELSNLITPIIYSECYAARRTRLKHCDVMFKYNMMSKSKYDSWIFAFNLQHEIINQAMFISIQQQLHLP